MRGMIRCGVVIGCGLVAAASAWGQDDRGGKGFDRNNRGGRSPELVGPGIVRFFPFGYAADAVPFSMSLKKPLEVTGELPETMRVRVAFSRGDSVIDPPGLAAIRHSAVIPAPPGTSLYGTGMVAGPLLRNGRRVVCWNTEGIGEGNGVSLGQSHPWVLAVRPDGTAFGVLADTTYRCEIDLTTGIKFTADGPEEGFTVIVIDRESPQEVVKGLAELTGTMRMPPRWALGYQHVVGENESAAQVTTIAGEFRKRDIPCDAVWVRPGAAGRRFDSSDAATLHQELRAGGYQAVWAVAPGDFGDGTEHMVKGADGKLLAFPDFSVAATREWWSGQEGAFLKTGAGGVWLVGNAGAMAEDAQHGGDGVLPAGPHARYHNVYGMLMSEAAGAGFGEEKRAFVATASSFIGGQRYAAAVIEGAASAEESVSMMLNMGLSGQPFAGAGIGGVDAEGEGAARGREPARWVGVGAFFPLARSGGVRAPWMDGVETERVYKAALEQRYRLMPYLYTLFHEASRTGLPVARPLFFADPTDMALRSEDDAFLLGADVLVKGKLSARGDRVVVTPRGIWNPLKIDRDGEVSEELASLYIRGGAIVPVGPVMEHTGEKPLNELELVVSLDEEGRAEGMMYEDAGDGYGYERNEYRLTRYVAETRDGVVSVRMASSEGGLAWSPRRVKVRLLVRNSEKLKAGEIVAGEHLAEFGSGDRVQINVRVEK